MQKEANEREAALKKWAMKNMRDNYEDFERLMGAKLNEIKALISVAGGGAAGASGAGDPKF